ncbi:MAG: hypothetical protein ABEH81_15335 [Halopenitus sp.]
MSSDEPPETTRRAVLGAMAGTGVAGLAGCSALESEPDSSTTALSDERARELATRFAPTLYFDAAEQWFPTDPRPYESEQDGSTVVDGFDAFDGYTKRYEESGSPPDPTVFFQALEYDESPLAVVQFWMYSAFDQFTTNFHWHDWEVLHVFVDTDTGDPKLYVASSHSRKIPNNEFLDPDPEMVPRILTELGSHSSALSVNAEVDAFQRLPTGGTFADITNDAIEGIEDLASIPAAYGLPRDEGSRLPYVVPELDGGALFDHERLPNVNASDLVPSELTVRSFDALTSPPTDIPQRATGLVFDHSERQAARTDVEYELVPTSDVEHIDDFVGPQLSFEFQVPQFAEDAIAGHITTTGTPWSQPRYENPATDISDGTHRSALAEQYAAIGAAGSVENVVAEVTEAVTTADAPTDEGLKTVESTVESVALFESEPSAAPTFRGVVMLQDVADGDHRLTVNGAGVAPHNEPVTVDSAAEGPTVAGADGEIPTVARGRSTKLEIDAAASDRDLSGLAVADDFAGRLYDAPLSGPDAVYVHDGGAYTTEVRDVDGAVGAYRVNPTDEDAVRIEKPSTGKGPLAGYLADVAEETRAAVAAVASDSDDSDDTSGNGSGGGTRNTGGSGNAVEGLAKALGTVAEAARRAQEAAEAGNAGNADQRLETVASRLETVSERLQQASDDLPDGLANATEQRLKQSRKRTKQARVAEKL